MLLGLLFVADWYFPISMPAAIAASDNDIDRSIIRIHSSHKWPSAVRMVTSAPMAAPAPAVADANPVRSPPQRVNQA